VPSRYEFRRIYFLYQIKNLSQIPHILAFDRGNGTTCFFTSPAQIHCTYTFVLSEVTISGEILNRRADNSFSPAERNERERERERETSVTWKKHTN
jgi:hypothetical protein